MAIALNGVYSIFILPISSDNSNKFSDILESKRGTIETCRQSQTEEELMLVAMYNNIL